MRRQTARTVSWLTTNLAARALRLRIPVKTRMPASWADVSFRRRDARYGARMERPMTRPGLASAMTT